MDERIIDAWHSYGHKGVTTGQIYSMIMCQITVIINKVCLICYMSLLSKPKLIPLFFTHNQLYFPTISASTLIVLIGRSIWNDHLKLSLILD